MRTPRHLEHLQRSSFIAAGVAFFGAVVLAQSTTQPTQGTDPVRSTADTTARTRAAAAPVVLKDINPSGSSDAAGFIRFRGATWFVANDGAHGFELWRTDGTPKGTTLAQDVNQGEASSGPDAFITFRGRLYFAATTTDAGREVWSTDGTDGGASIVSDINPGAGTADPATFTRFRDRLFFRAQDGGTGLELWSTQGTPDTTAQVMDLHPGAEGSIPTFPTAFRGALYFSADDLFTPGVDFNREL